MNEMTTQDFLLYREPHRPQIHFSPPKNWMNDPNGMVFYKGVYHLFYQHNPDAHVWGNMHWGHATSKDLVHWEHRPIALHAEPDGLGYIFSGSAVVDWRNTTGLGSVKNPPLVALFTHSTDEGFQVQSLAYSVDEGSNWHMYEHNPVLGNPGVEHFRDPKILWDERARCWIMVLAAEKVIKFYRSDNLLAWQLLSNFKPPSDDPDLCLECPDLFPLRDPVSGRDKWVLIISQVSGTPNGGSGTQYLIGEFDGERFMPEHDEVLWLDYGPDCYAGVTWSDEPNNHQQRSFIAWMSNWRYANDVPTSPWRGAMTVPRTLSLVDTQFGLRLASPPIAQYTLLAQESATKHLTNVVVEGPQTLVDGINTIAALSLDLTFDRASVGSGFVVQIDNHAGQSLNLSIDVEKGVARLDRRQCAFDLEHNESFIQCLEAPLLLHDREKLNYHLVVDKSSIEVFETFGLALFTCLYYSAEPLEKISISPLNGGETALVRDVDVRNLKSIWE